MVRPRDTKQYLQIFSNLLKNSSIRFFSNLLKIVEQRRIEIIKAFSIPVFSSSKTYLKSESDPIPWKNLSLNSSFSLDSEYLYNVSGNDYVKDEEAFVVLYSDDLILGEGDVKTLIEDYEKAPNAKAVIAAQEMPEEVWHKYGMIALKENGTLSHIVEKPKTPDLAPSNLTSYGRYLLTPEVFDYLIPSSLESSVKVGIRVYVPFGRMKLEGFVLEIKDCQDTDRELKEIIDIIISVIIVNR